MDKQKLLDRVQTLRSSAREGARGAIDKVNSFVDEGSFVELDALVMTNGSCESVVCGYATIFGSPVCIWAEEKSNGKGAMSSTHAEKIIKLYDFAKKTGTPVICFPDALGAELSEGIDVLGAYGKLISASAAISGVVPQIAVVTGECYGVEAIAALCADFVVALKGQTKLQASTDLVLDASGRNKKQLESNLNAYASYVAEDMEDCIYTVQQLVMMLPQNNMADSPELETEDDMNRVIPELKEIAVSEEQKDIREVVRHTADEGQFLELYSQYAKEIVVGFATFGGMTAGIVATQKMENKGKLTAQSAAKAADFIRFCDSFHIPVVTFVDTKGFEVSLKQEKRLALTAQKKLAGAYANATTALITIVLSEAIGSGYVVMGSKDCGADMVYAWPTAVISPLSIEAAADVFYEEEMNQAANMAAARREFEQKYVEEHALALVAAEKGYIDNVIAPETTRIWVISALMALHGKRSFGIPKKHSTL